MITPKFKIWLKAAGIRALRTFAQAAIATIGTAFVLSDAGGSELQILSSRKAYFDGDIEIQDRKTVWQGVI